MKRLKDRVFKILETNLEARDNHYLTTAIIWAEDIGETKLSKMSAKELLDVISTGELSRSETIRKATNAFEKISTQNQGSTYQDRMATHRIIASQKSYQKNVKIKE